MWRPGGPTYPTALNDKGSVMTLGVKMTCSSRPATSSVLHQACTHDAGTPKSLGRGPLGEARLGGEESPERLKKTGMQNKCDSYTMCMSDAGMQNEV